MLTCLEPPSADLANLEEVKAHLTIDHTHDDERLMQYMAMARDMVEADTNRCLVSQSWRNAYPCFTRRMYLNKAPVLFDVQGTPDMLISYRDTSGLIVAVEEEDYVVVNHPLPCVIFDAGFSFPTLKDTPEAVRIDYTCKTTDTRILNLAKIAQMQLIASWNEVREDSLIGVAAAPTALGYQRIISLIRGVTIC